MMDRIAKKVAEIAQFDEKQLQSYRDSEKNYLDFTASLITSFKEGKAEGKIEITKNLIMLGLDNERITKATGLSIQEIEALRKENDG